MELALFEPSLLGSWIRGRDLVVFDSSVCNKELRVLLLDLYCQNNFSLKNEDDANNDYLSSKQIKWLCSRGISMTTVKMSFQNSDSEDFLLLGDEDEDDLTKTFWAKTKHLVLKDASKRSLSTHNILFLISRCPTLSHLSVYNVENFGDFVLYNSPVLTKLSSFKFSGHISGASIIQGLIYKGHIGWCRHMLHLHLDGFCDEIVTDGIGFYDSNNALRKNVLTIDGLNTFVGDCVCLKTIFIGEALVMKAYFLDTILDNCCDITSITLKHYFDTTYANGTAGQRLLSNCQSLLYVSIGEAFSYKFRPVPYDCHMNVTGDIDYMNQKMSGVRPSFRLDDECLGLILSPLHYKQDKMCKGLSHFESMSIGDQSVSTALSRHTETLRCITIHNDRSSYYQDDQGDEYLMAFGELLKKCKKLASLHLNVDAASMFLILCRNRLTITEFSVRNCEKVRAVIADCIKDYNTLPVLHELRFI